MSDIVKRLRGQEPLNLGDRLLCADEIDRLISERDALREMVKEECEENFRLRAENARLRELLDRAGEALPSCELYVEIQAALAAGGE